VQWNIKPLSEIIKLEAGHVEAFHQTVKRFILMYIRRFCERTNGKGMQETLKYQKQRGRNKEVLLIINTLKLQVASVL
jgi:hypothetical protein